MTKIDLDYPLTINSETVNTLKMRRPKVRDMIAAEKDSVGDAEKELALFANLCELTPDAILDVDGKDYLKIQAVYSGFLY